MLAPHSIVTRQAVDQIFHVPEEVRNQPPPPVSSVSPPPSGQYLDASIPGAPTQPSGGRDDHQGQGPLNLDRQEGGAVEGRPDLDIDFPEPGYCPEEDDEDEEDEDMINGLTFPEMRTVLQRVSDGRISDGERADAAMLMLGMGGGELMLLYHFTPLFLILGNRP